MLTFQHNFGSISIGLGACESGGVSLNGNLYHF